MDREYLEDYENRENAEIEKLLRRIEEGNFSFERDKYPSDNRFVNLQKPVAFTEFEGANINNLWAQIPFCGSLIVCLVPASESDFEQIYFRKSEIQKVIDFVKETGKLQFALSRRPTEFEGLDFLEPFFQQLRPPELQSVPMTAFGSEKEIQRAIASYKTIGKIRFFNYVGEKFTKRFVLSVLEKFGAIYANLYLRRYSLLQDLENLMVDNPERAVEMFVICRKFIYESGGNLRCDLFNFTLANLHEAQDLPLVYQPKALRFPCEIGRFLLEKLTYAPRGPRACIDIIDHYSSYDLQKVQTSLNEAIVTNHPGIVNKNAKELYEILDNVWKDQTIPGKIKNIEIGVPVSIAAIGGVAGTIVGELVGGPGGAVIGGASGVGIGDFLTKLGFKVGEKTIEKLFNVKGEEVTGKLAKLRTRSYQANIYDFKKKYKGKITE